MENLASSPVSYIETDSPEREVEQGMALCLSGGGYRAMLFHLGALIRLNQLGYLQKLKRISSVSGGSITSGVLGFQWRKLHFENGIATNFKESVVSPIRSLADHSIDIRSILFGALGPGSIGDKLTNYYRKHLFGTATLQALPDEPRFVLNATNVQSKVLWRFSKPYMRDYRVGEVPTPDIDLATAVAASSAFPPVLSPVTLILSPGMYTPKSGLDLQKEPFTSKVVLTDGGVYDNLGLETAWKRYDTILVSDGGGMYPPDPKPKLDWLRHTKRVFDLIDNQVRSLRKRQVIDSYDASVRRGAYWGIGSHIDQYAPANYLACDPNTTDALAGISTRLKRLPAKTQEKLINWGYAICDAAIRKYFDPKSPIPDGLYYPNSPLR